MKFGGPVNRRSEEETLRAEQLEALLQYLTVLIQDVVIAFLIVSFSLKRAIKSLHTLENNCRLHPILIDSSPNNLLPITKVHSCESSPPCLTDCLLKRSNLSLSVHIPYPNRVYTAICRYYVVCQGQVCGFSIQQRL
jgi:hypothetical protein